MRVGGEMKDQTEIEKKEDEKTPIVSRLGGVRAFKVSSEVESLYSLVSESNLRKEVKLIFKKIFSLKASSKKKHKKKNSSSRSSQKKLH